MNDTLIQEQRRFSKAADYIRDEMKRIDRRFELGEHAGDEAAEESVRSLLESRYRMLLRAKEQPFFARIDFKESGKPAPEKTYLGKTTVSDGDGGIIVVDWRAPVASLYYENRLGSAMYTCPDGEVSGDLLLKRKYTVGNGKLLGFEDVDITSDDELLGPYLSVSSDSRLKSIISTIQSEQNRVIRAELGRHLIVQGAAGSGKTTVALHRAAYFVYTWAGRFLPEHFMVLAPNDCFLSYIAPVLPDLGVENVSQTTFEALARDILRLKSPIEDPVAGLTAVMEGNGFPELRAYKCSLQCKRDIDVFLQHRQIHTVPGSSKRPSILKLYREFLGVNKNKLTWEDLTPLLYMHLRLRGTEFRRLRHLIIDEAQDMPPFTLTVLKELYPNASFSLLGDLAQGIFSWRCPDNWEVLNDTVFDGKARICVLNKSYRSTLEIMESAGYVLKAAGLPPCEAVIRHGGPVERRLALAPNERIHHIIDALERYARHSRIAILLKTPSACRDIAKRLGGAYQILDSSAELPDSKVLILSSASAKGLEFDAVIIADAESYSAGEARLLYVAMTRAMHDLTVIGLGNLGQLTIDG